MSGLGRHCGVESSHIRLWSENQNWTCWKASW